MTWNLLIPPIVAAIVTALLNVIFYFWVKRKVDQKIEKVKIAYSGIYKERIEVYRELLSRIKYLIRSHIKYAERKPQNPLEFHFTIRDQLLDFNDFYSINQAFFSNKVIMRANELQNLLEGFYNDIYSNYVAPETFRNTKHGRKKLEELLQKHFEAMNKLKEKNTFKHIEDDIVSEMKRHLYIDEL